MKFIDVLIIILVSLPVIALVGIMLKRRKARAAGEVIGCAGCKSCSFCEGCKESAGENPRRRAIIITGYLRGSIKNTVEISKDDFVICADGGYDLARAEGIEPNFVIGDFDSIQNEVEASVAREKLPAEKDETDTFHCIEKAVALSCKEIIIVGGIGGRLDHTFANIQLVANYAERGEKISMMDEYTTLFFMGEGEIVIPKSDRKLSIFSYSKEAVISESGVKYPLSHKRITNTFPLGVSNEWEGDAVLTCHSGKLLIMFVKEKGK